MPNNSLGVDHCINSLVVRHVAVPNETTVSKYINQCSCSYTERNLFCFLKLAQLWWLADDEGWTRFFSNCWHCLTSWMVRSELSIIITLFLRLTFCSDILLIPAIKWMLHKHETGYQHKGFSLRKVVIICKLTDSLCTQDSNTLVFLYNHATIASFELTTGKCKLTPYFKLEKSSVKRRRYD